MGTAAVETNVAYRALHTLYNPKCPQLSARRHAHSIAAARLVRVGETGPAQQFIGMKIHT